MEFSRQEHWSGLPCPPPGHLPNPGIEHLSPTSPALQADALPIESPGKPLLQYMFQKKPRFHQSPNHPCLPGERAGVWERQSCLETFVITMGTYWIPRGWEDGFIKCDQWQFWLGNWGLSNRVPFRQQSAPFVQTQGGYLPLTKTNRRAVITQCQTAARHAILDFMFSRRSFATKKMACLPSWMVAVFKVLEAL